MLGTTITCEFHPHATVSLTGKAKPCTQHPQTEPGNEKTAKTCLASVITSQRATPSHRDHLNAATEHGAPKNKNR